MLEEIEEIEIVEDVDPMVVGPYALFDEIASGGMASVHLGRLLAADGLGRTVAIKRMHRAYTNDPDFCAMFVDESRFVGRLRHRNVVRMVDVVQSDEGLFLVMEYVHGESLSRLIRLAREANELIPARLFATLVHGVLLGLHSAHELTADDGKLLGVVHRDISPQNVIVGADGRPRVLDFGVAKAAGRMQTTHAGQLKGKLAYMAREQISGAVDRRTDVFATGVVLWEGLAGRRLHEGAKDAEIVSRIVAGVYPPPSAYALDVPPELDRIVLQALSSDPSKRFPTARHMADELASGVALVSRVEVAAWVKRLASDVLEDRAQKVVAMERAAVDLVPSAPVQVATVPPSAPSLPPSVDERRSSLDHARAISRELDDTSPSVPPAPLNSRTAMPTVPPSKQRTSTRAVRDAKTTPTQTTSGGAAIPIDHDADAPMPRPRPPLVRYSFASTVVLTMLVGAGYGLYRKGLSDGRSEANAATAPPPVREDQPMPSAGASEQAPLPPTARADADASAAAAAPPTETTMPGKPDGGSSAPEMPSAPAGSVQQRTARRCDPPWVKDDAGIKRYRPDCIGF